LNEEFNNGWFTMKIKAAVLYEANQPFQIETVDLEPPQAGEVLVKVAAAGVCHSDYHLVTGDTKHAMPVVAGHEGAGVVEAVGEGVTGLKPGDNVALNWAPNCGECFYCLRDRPSLCTTYIEPLWAGTMMDGTPRLSIDGQPVYHFSAVACFADYTVDRCGFGFKYGPGGARQQRGRLRRRWGRFEHHHGGQVGRGRPNHRY
jgi:Zn-dependent alcohol dehydrogenase